MKNAYLRIAFESSDVNAQVPFDGVPGEVNSFSLHGFCDASKHAYAAVVYLVIETPMVDSPDLLR